MIRHYDEIPKEEVDRQGQSWIFCDVSTCNASAQIEGVEERTRQEGPYTITERFAPLPDGWASDDDNALHGSADFCKKHSSRISVVDEELPPVTDAAP